LSILVLTAALATAGCARNSALVRMANELFPPVRPADHQVAAVQAAARDIEGLSSALVYIGVSQRDLEAHVPSEIQSRMADATNIQVRLGQQEVVVAAGYDVRVPGDDDVRIRGDVVAHCAVSIEESALVLRPSASQVSVRRIQYRGNKAPDLLIEGINLALRTFLDNLNGAIQAQRVPLDLSAMQVFDTTRLLNGLETVSTAQGRTFSVDVALGKSSVLIDSEGIHVLADAVVLTQEHFDTTLRELQERNAEPLRVASLGTTPPSASFTSEQLALLSLCPSLPAGLDARVERLRAVCESLDAPAGALVLRAAAEPAEDGPEEDLEVIYPRFRDTFLTKVELVDRKENLFWDRTAVAISRRSLAADLNAVLAHGQGSASLRFPEYTGDVKEKTLTPDPPNLKCAENAGGCDSDFSFRGYNPRGCDSDCSTMNCHGPSWARICLPGVDLQCLGRKADCERLKEQERLGYEAEKAAAFVAWKVRKDACELAKVAKLAGCNINQDWLNLVGNKDVGEVQARWQADSGELHIVIDGLRVGDDLDSFSARGSLSGGANVAADFTFIPHNAGHLACVAQWSGRVHAAAHLPLKEVSFTGRLTEARNEEKKLVLTFSLPGETFDVKVEPPPALALVTQNPQIAAYCPVPTLIVAQIASLAGAFDPVSIYALIKLGEAALKDTFSYELQGREVTVELPERTIEIGGKPVALLPRWQEKSIVIYAR
jgi:hypothetical protein